MSESFKFGKKRKSVIYRNFRCIIKRSGGRGKVFTDFQTLNDVKAPEITVILEKEQL